jgi:hypothetical protein
MEKGVWAGSTGVDSTQGHGPGGLSAVLRDPGPQGPPDYPWLLPVDSSVSLSKFWIWISLLSVK